MPLSLSFRRPDNNNPRSMTSRFRRRRFLIIEGIISEIIAENGVARIIDVGGRRDYWNLLDPEMAQKVHITLVNLEGEIDRGREQGGNRFAYVTGDGCALDYDDNAFDLAHSNSTIEHVGSLAAMIPFAGEVRRIAPRYYVQTPYLWFPIDPHVGVPFFHWLPGPTRASLVSRRKVGYSDRKPYREALASVDHTEMVDARLMRELFPDAALRKERFLGLTKSLIVVR